MEALREIDRKAFFHLFTSVPEWFFSLSLADNYRYHRLVCDVGFVQPDPYRIDFKATEKALAALLPFRPKVTDAVARQLAGCSLAVCDIAPLGIHAASRAGIPSVLLENFTWDHLYDYFRPRQPFLGEWSSLLRQSFSCADHHIQTEPLCRRDAKADLLIGPVSRWPRLTREQVRNKLSIAADRKMVLVTLGGFPSVLPDLEAGAANLPDIIFVVPSQNKGIGRSRNIVSLPQQNEIAHVDIVYGADVLVCKAGYSTLSEGYCAGIPTAAILRPDYPETPALAAFVEKEMKGTCLLADSMEEESWIATVPKLLAQARHPVMPSAASKVARFLVGLL